MATAGWTRYVAVGDSITEGLCDAVAGDRERWMGWADRLAAILDSATGGIEFANLAVRGRRVTDVLERQIPAAIALDADLVSVMIGGNDLMTAVADPDALAARIEGGVVELRKRGIDVLLATCFDPQFAFFLKPLRGRAAVFNANLWSIARNHSAYTLDLWGMHELRNRSMWAEDRVHLTTAGHRILAGRAARALGLDDDEEFPWNPPTASHHLPLTVWARRYALPWLGRRMRGVSLGDGMPAKQPSPEPVAARR
ncbi:SGNH/GDSL hydrolase family protein [Glaciihabitans sp. UYNi722]|uniref:SGNH/GDSL hydrolase family protein n=1 Tax=Glaciihabitans sp. UYNi722 TaxID=3156344 RepID=UPI00339B9807